MQLCRRADPVPQSADPRLLDPDAGGADRDARRDRRRARRRRPRLRALLGGLRAHGRRRRKLARSPRRRSPGGSQPDRRGARARLPADARAARLRARLAAGCLGGRHSLRRVSEGASPRSDTAEEDALRLAVPSGACVERTRDEPCSRRLRATPSRKHASRRASTYSWSASTRWQRRSRRRHPRWRRRTERSRASGATSRPATRRLQELAAQARLTSQAPAGDPALDVNELRSLRNAVAALTKERAEGGSAPQIEDLVSESARPGATPRRAVGDRSDDDGCMRSQPIPE